MSEEKQQSSQGTVVTVREAARRLGVSERTVYRRLKSGKLPAAPVSNKLDINDNMSVIVKHIQLENGHVSGSHNMSEYVNQSTPSPADDTLRHALLTLGKRDAEIARMIEYQQEMTQTIARLQEQMFELTRLVIAMNLEKSDPAPEDKLSQQGIGNKADETSENMIRRWIESLKARMTNR